VASGEPSGGVVQPFTQVSEGEPWVFGGFCGSAGWVGVGRVEAVVTGLGAFEVVEAAAVAVEAVDVDLEGVDDADVVLVEASQDTAASAASIAIGSKKCLCIG